MTTFPEHFLWGAATAGHQIEGNNVNSDWWAREQLMPGMELSGDACDSYHRYAEDIQLLADAGLTAYRFSLEWSRIEPIRGRFSRAELAHYRRVIDACLDRGITPVVTLQHFTTPQWFAEAGGWSSAEAKDLFSRYVEQACTILDGVEWVATMNEPNMQAAIMTAMKRMEQAGGQWQSPTVEAEYDSDEEREQAARNNFLAYADPAISRAFVEIHHAARDIVRQHTDAKVGWTIAAGALTAAPGGEEKLLEIRYGKEDIFWEGSRGDDWAGVQAYSSQQVDANGLVPHPQLPDNTLVGTTYRPDSLAMAVRHATEVTQGVPIMITENGIATADDTQRIRYTDEALQRSARNHRRRHRRARLPALVAAGQLRVGPLGADLRPDRRRPRNVRTHPQAQPRLARPGRPAQRAPSGGARVSFPFADVSASPIGELLSLRGRRALVTGGARGLGKAIALRLAEAGAAVAIADIDETLARNAASDIAGRSDADVVGVRMDVTDAASVRSAAATAVAELGGLDIWINNAGVFPSIPVLETHDDAWERVFAVNTRGVFNGSREAARQMAPNASGVIVNIVSTAGFEGTAPGLSAYVGSKHAVRGMTKQMALEFAPLGIRVLGVAPTFVPTEGNMAAAAAAMEAAGLDPAATPPVMKQSLIGRLGTPDDIARVVLFCASDMSMIMTGSTVLADAGQTI